MVKVTVCPPGRTKGAGDLQKWASRRLGGKFGVPEKKPEKPTKDERRRRQKNIEIAAKARREARANGAILGSPPWVDRYWETKS
jgi:hypothetical protein